MLAVLMLAAACTAPHSSPPGPGAAGPAGNGTGAGTVVWLADPSAETATDDVRQVLSDAFEQAYPSIQVIDQFEEVFTECGDEVQRSRFIEAVCAITGGQQNDPPPALVIIGLNLAFVEQCTAHPVLAPALRDPFIVGPMTMAELREAITLPASQAGLVVEPELVGTMLADIGAVESRGTAGLLTYDPGKLPLLAHALLATWERREGIRLTVAAYHAAGRIRDGIAATADQLYMSLDAPGRQVAKRLLRHMVRVHPEAEDSRRQVSRKTLLAELPAGDQESAARLLDEFGKRRLVTADEGGKVQIAHEALLRHWPTLAAWLQEDRDWQQAEQRLPSGHMSGRLTAETPPCCFAAPSSHCSKRSWTSHVALSSATRRSPSCLKPNGGRRAPGVPGDQCWPYSPCSRSWPAASRPWPTTTPRSPASKGRSPCPASLMPRQPASAPATREGHCCCP